MKSKLLHWIPRVLSMIFVLFLCLFSLDGFTEFNGWQTVLVVTTHLIIPFVVLLGTIIAWKRDLVGTIIFFFFAMYYVYMVGLGRHFSWYVSISGPALLIAILFFINWLSSRKNIQNFQYIKTKDGLEIFTESIGNKNNPAIILIMGAMNQSVFWYDSFCKKLADSGFFVIRYDHRDTGFSSVVDFKENSYTLDNLTEDVICILDGYNISKAHIVGISMGGYIGQLLAINYPNRVETLTLISTTADQRPYMDATMGNFNNKYELPYPSQKFIDYIENSKNNPPKDDEGFINSQIEGWKIFFGHELSKEDLDELIRLITLSNNRNKNKFSPFNHGLAVANSKDRMELVKNIYAPTLIIHGGKDICFGVKHSQFLNKNIPNSKLEVIENIGHMFSLSESDILISKILNNI